MNKKILIILLSFITLKSSYSQVGCSITPFLSSGTNPVECGDSIFLDFTVYADLVLNEAFTNGGPSDTSWVSTSGAIFTNPYIPSPTNDPYFWMGTSPIVPTALTSTPFNVAAGGQVCFDFVYSVQGGTAPTEGPDLYEEGITLQYNTGAGWVDMVYYAPNGDTLPANPGPGVGPAITATSPVNFTQWTSVCIDIPPSAMTTATSFQWIQEFYSGPNFDHWGLDNIVIATASPLFNIYLENDSSNLGPAPVTYGALISTDSTFNFYYTDESTDTCYSSFDAFITPTDVGPDLILDCNTNVVQLQATGVSTEDNYSWSPITALSDPNILNPTASPLDTIDYIFTSSCGSDTVRVNVVSNYYFATSNDTSICVGDTAYLEVFGGAQTYAWTVNSGDFSSISDPSIANPAFFPNTTTSYTVTSDSAGCIKTADIVISVSNKVFNLLILTDADCTGGNTGSAIIFANGSLDPISYTLSDGINPPITQTSVSFSNLPGGNYTVIANDSMSACPVDTNFTLIGGYAVNIDSVYAVNPLCVGDTGGLFEVFIDTALAAMYSINGAPAQASNIFTGLSDGIYSISAQFGTCPASVYIDTLSAPATVDLTFIDSTDLSCSGAGDGGITVSAFLGNGPYSYSTDNITFQADSFFTSLDAGNYVIYTQDANGCKDSITTSISEPVAPLINNVVVTDALCFGDSGSISFDVINGTNPYQYSIDSGMNFSSSNVFNNLPVGDYVLQGIDDNGCLSTIVTDTINEPSLIVLVEDSTDDSTCGALDGAIYMSASGGQGALTYNIDGGAFGASSTFTGLGAGPHTIIVMDANNCSASATVIIANSGGATLSIASFDSILCNGMTNASVQLSTTGGTAPFQFNVDLGTNQPDSLFTGLSGGVHSFTVIDANNCQDNVSITIYEPAVLDLTATQDSVSCFGLSDGEIDLTATGGTSPYVYALNDTSVVQLTPNFSSLSEGSNMAYVVDVNGCIDSVAQVVLEADSLEITNLFTDSVNCFGGNDGQISFDALGGIPAYSYSIDGGASFVTTNTFTVDTGSYDLMLEDANGCQSELGIATIFEPSVLELDSINVIQTTCNLDNGSLEVLASGGVGSYNYTLNGGLTQTTGLFTNLSAMTHTIVVTDANLICSETITIDLDAVPSVALSLVSSTNVSCNGAADGTANLSAINGFGTYSFTLIGGATQASPNFTNLNGGTNVFVVSDGTCTDTLLVNILEPATISLSSVQDSVSCNSFADGQIVLTASGGASSFAYALNDTSITQISSTFTGLSAGINTSYVIDTNGCIDSVVQEVFEPDTLIITSVNVLDISCTADGSFTVNTSGGISPYTYSISGGATNQASNVLDVSLGGTYTLSVDDANGCPTATVIDSVDAPIPVTFVLDSITDTLECNNSFDGLISAYASGGSGPYTYSINNAPFQTDTFFSGLSAGTYVISVEDAFNCPSTPLTISATIYQPNGIVEVTSSNDISCNGLTDGSITINTITGGTAPYNVTVNSVTMVYTPNMVYDNLPAGTYTGTIEDANGCALSFTETVSDVPALSITLENLVEVSCFGAADAQISFTLSGGTLPYTNTISFGAFSDTAITDGAFSFSNLEGSEAGIDYNITTTDANGCSVSITQTITQPNQLIIDSISIEPLTCFGANDAELAVSASGGSSPYTYLWTPGNETGNMASGLNSGVYSVAVTDSNNCTITASQTVETVDPIIATIIPDSAIINMGDTVQLGVNVQNAIGTNFQYSWSPTIGLSCTDCQNPVVNMYNDIAYSVVVTDENNCDSYNFTEVYVLVDGSLFYFIPNGFTPNGDGINDRFQVFGQDIQSVDMKIFNRWGEKIFEGNNQNQSWDGNFKGVAQGNGVYSYIVNIKFLNDAEVVEKGSVTLIK